MTEELLPTDPSRIGGHRILARLGAGGMGVVYLGRTHSGGLAAVKLIRAEYADEPDFRTRFRREAAAARRVVSPWVAAVSGADTEAASPWLATAFVPGPSLAEAVAAYGALPEHGVRVLGKMLARALTAVHEASLVHRDVKPANVLLAIDGPRLIDFGIARLTDEAALTTAGVVVGTPGFLAPELALGQEREAQAGLGHASDVFSLGCLLAYAATGRPPFGTGPTDALLYRTVHEEPDLDGVPGTTRALLERCLAKNPAGRPTAREIDEGLVEDTPEQVADWLPDAVVRLIARRSGEMLALPDIDATMYEGAPDARTQTEPGGPEPRPSAGRRSFLTLASGGAVLLASGAGLWAASADGGRPVTSAPRPRRWVIGLQADLSGPGRDAGRAQERAARLAVEQFNSRKDKPFTVTLAVADDRGDPGRAVQAARSLADDRDTLAVLGSTADDTTEVAVGVYSGRQVPQLTVSSCTAAYGDQQYPFLLRTSPTYATSTFSSAFMARSLGVERAVVLIDRAGGTAAWQAGSALHGQLAGNRIDAHARVVPRTASRPASVLPEMLERDPDAFFYYGTSDRAATVARALAQRKFDGTRILGFTAADGRFLRQAGRAAEGWEVFAPYIDPADPKVRAFADAHRRRYGGPPQHWAVETYDVTRMVLDRLAGAAEGGRRPTRGALLTLLAKGRYAGVGRTYAFTGQNVTELGSFRYRVAGGRYAYLGHKLF